MSVAWNPYPRVADETDIEYVDKEIIAIPPPEKPIIESVPSCANETNALLSPSRFML
jgi:hypothetical protein